ncbi:MAG: helix-turn-helix transcriptional regulator [Saprospiraceae bacterium]|nr:helix-turn-helix transcriptional regulator [Saprospiraceae bacterium]
MKHEIIGIFETKRSTTGLTQPELAEKAGVGLRFVRELEQGKETLRLDKVNQVLKRFGYEMGPVKSEPSINNEQDEKG